MFKSFSKKVKFFPLIFVILLCIIIILSFFVVHIWFGITSDWKYNVKGFDDYIRDFEKVATYCLSYKQEKINSSNTLDIFVYSTKKELLYDWQAIELDDGIAESLKKISGAFPHKDAQFESITIKNEVVYFETHNGLYSIVYSPLEKPQYVDGKNEGISKRIQNNWYHVIKK